MGGGFGGHLAIRRCCDVALDQSRQIRELRCWQRGRAAGRQRLPDRCASGSDRGHRFGRRREIPRSPIGLLDEISGGGRVRQQARDRGGRRGRIGHLDARSPERTIACAPGGTTDDEPAASLDRNLVAGCQADDRAVRERSSLLQGGVDQARGRDGGVIPGRRPSSARRTSRRRREPLGEMVERGAGLRVLQVASLGLPAARGSQARQVVRQRFRRPDAALNAE